MNEEKESELYNKAITTWGIIPQELMMIEEASELIKAILKLQRFSNRKITLEDSIEEYQKELQRLRLNLVDEMVDTQIMLNQMKIIHNYKDDYDRIYQEKLERTAKRLGMIK